MRRTGTSLLVLVLLLVLLLVLESNRPPLAGSPDRTRPLAAPFRARIIVGSSQRMKWGNFDSSLDRPLAELPRPPSHGRRTRERSVPINAAGRGPAAI